MTISTTRYLLQDYDYILLVASWGLLKGYKRAVYHLEVEKSNETGFRRAIVSDQKLHRSSTTAIRDILKDKLNIDNLDLLIFVQDTLLLDRIIQYEDRYFNKAFLRCELEESLLYELYNSNKEVAEELGVREAKDYEKLTMFVPGVIVTKSGAYVYSWRGERVYNILKGLIIFYIYRKLKSIPESVRRIAILLDTTHGINYFVTALKEGVSIGATLYAFDRLIDTIIRNGFQLNEIVVYHYNSDPIRPSEADEYSLKIHLLEKIPIMKQGKINFTRILTIIKEPLSIMGYADLRNWFDNMWRNVEWDKIIQALALFSKGLLIWALRVALDIGELPEEEDIEYVAKNIGLSFRMNKRVYKIDYSSQRVPVSQVIEYITLAKSLKNLARRIKFRNNISRTVSKIVDCLINESKENEETKELVNILENLIKIKDRIACLDIELLLRSVKTLYDSPYVDINVNELKELKRYLLGENEPKWIPVSDHTYIEPKSKCAFFVDYRGLKMLVSIPNNVNPRDFFAHAGLAYGLQWFALGKQGKVILCLGDYRKVLQLLHTAPI